jgi:hypothetical protein
MDEKRFEKMVEDFKSLTDEQKKALRDALGILTPTAKVSTGVRVTGKVKRTEKVLEEKIAKQMQILIDVLPKDKAIDIAEWGTLAVAGGLQTQQPADRIAAYYKKAIIEGGFAVIVN